MIAYTTVKPLTASARQLLSKKSQRALVFRTIVLSKRALSAAEVSKRVKPHVTRFYAGWHLSKLRREGLVTASGKSATQKLLAVHKNQRDDNALTLSIPMPTSGLAREIASRTGRWYTITAPRADIYARLEKALGVEQARAAMSAVGFFEITEPVQHNELFGRINEGIKASMRQIGFKS